MNIAKFFLSLSIFSSITLSILVQNVFAQVEEEAPPSMVNSGNPDTSEEPPTLAKPLGNSETKLGDASEDSMPMATRAPVSAPPSESPTETATPLPQSSAEQAQSKSSDILELHALLSEKIYRTKNTPENRIKYIEALERRVGPLCMPHLTRDLIYTGMSKTEECSDWIEKILDLDPENPSAICARDGIDSRSCRTAYSKVQVGTYDPTEYINSSDPMEAVEAKIAVSRNASEISTIEAQLEKLTFERPKGDQVEILREKRKVLYNQLLALACTSIRLSITTSSTPPGEPGSSKKNLIISDAELESFGIPSTTLNNPGPAARYTIHKRLLIPRCDRAIKLALNAFPELPSPLCQKFGYYSPQCVEAKRAEKSAKRTELKKQGTDLPAPKDPDIGRF